MSATALPSEEDLLLTLSEAHALLKSLGRTVEKVVRACDDDAILFIGAFGRPWTAWLTREDGRIAAVQYEEGFSTHFGSCARVSSPTPVPADPQIESD